MTSGYSTAAAWAILGRPSTAQYESYGLKAVGARYVRAAVDTDGNRHVLVPVKVRPTQIPAAGEVVKFDVLPLAFGDDRGLVLDITCTDSAVHTEFDLLIEEVTEAIDSIETAGSAALDAIDRWRRLLALQRSRGLSFIEQMGLVAELVVLDRALEVDANTWGAWRGPFREPHDFEFDRGCVEVKALGDSTDVEIHGLEQLSEHDGKTLALALIEVFEADDGSTVVEAARRVRDRHRVDISKPLSAAGVDMTQNDPTMSRFQTGSVVIIRITTQTPHLSVSIGSFEQDFSDVHYRLSTAALLPHSTGQNLNELLKEVIHA